VRLSGGEVRVPDGTPAGSALTPDQALRNVIQFAGLPLEEAAVLVTGTRPGSWGSRAGSGP
jgi:N-acetylglucosamine-6-phosphate deacetylase